MKKSVSTAVAGVALALTTSSLALVMPATSANAVTAACSSANTAKAKAATAKTKAVKAQKKAKKNVTKAKKALKKKRTKATVKKVKLTKKKLTKANKNLRAANRRLTVALSNQKRACASTSTVKPPVTTPPSTDQQQAEALAAVLKLLLVQMDKDQTDVSLLGKQGVKGLLNSAAPQLGDLVSDDILGTVVSLLKGPVGDMTTAAKDASKMFQAAFGQYLDPAVLAGLANMEKFDPVAAAAMFTTVFQGLADKFGFTGTLPTFDATMVTGFLAQLQNLANPELLKGLGLTAFEDVFKSMIGGTPPKFSAATLTGLVKQASGLPGFNSLKDLTMLSGVLGGLTGGAGGLEQIPVLGGILKGLLCVLPLPVLCS